MFKRGQIVYHDHVVFGDNRTDLKEKRPCVVLFSIEFDDNIYVCTCPFTSQVKSFNKHPDKYKFIHEQVYQYRKLSFAKLDSIRLYPFEETHATPYFLDDKIVESIITSFKNMKNKSNESKVIKYFLDYDRLFEQLEQKEVSKTKKLERNEKRRNAKKQIYLQDNINIRR